MAGADRVSSVGKQVVFTVVQGDRASAIGKQVTFPVHNGMRVSAIGKQVVWTMAAAAPPPPPPPPPVTPPTIGAPNSAAARGGAFYMDSTLEYDGRHVSTNDGLSPGVSLALSGGSTWAAGETLTLTASEPVFVSGDVGNVLILHGSEVRFTITGFTSSTVVTGVGNVAIPTGMQSGDITVWDKAIDQVAGVDHLEGEFVAIMGDDHVVGSPYNARITLRQVISGVVQLGDFYTHVFVGLPYLSDLETLDIDRPQGPSLKINKIDITKIGVMLLQSRPAFYGRQPPTNDAVDPLEDLREMPIPTDPNYEVLTSDYSDVNILSLDWNSHGRIFIRSVDPTPHTVLAVVPQGYLPGGA
jgi:hypothetical protein